MQVNDISAVSVLFHTWTRQQVAYCRVLLCDELSIIAIYSEIYDDYEYGRIGKSHITSKAADWFRHFVLCCVCFVVPIFICIFCIFMTYSTSYCCHYELTDPWKCVCVFWKKCPMKIHEK